MITSNMPFRLKRAEVAALIAVAIIWDYTTNVAYLGTWL